MSRLSENLGKKFVYTTEIAPPKGADLGKFNKELKELKKIYPRLSAVNVVDIPGSILLMSSLGACVLVEQEGMEPVYQITCRDRNVLGLQADLLTAQAFGIRNVLALTGDHPRCKSSDHPDAKPVFDLDSARLIRVMGKMNQSVDAAGNRLRGGTDFFIGAALAQTPSPIEPEVYKTKRKIDAGAKYFQTQAMFCPERMWGFLEKYEKFFGEDIRQKVIVGLVCLYDYEILKFVKTIPNVIIPKEIDQRIKNAENQFEEGVNIVLEYIDLLKEHDLGGAHVMSAGNAEALMQVFKKM